MPSIKSHHVVALPLLVGFSSLAHAYPLPASATTPEQCINANQQVTMIYSNSTLAPAALDPVANIFGGNSRSVDILPGHPRYFSPSSGGVPGSTHFAEPSSFDTAEFARIGVIVAEGDFCKLMAEFSRLHEREFESRGSAEAVIKSVVGMLQQKEVELAELKAAFADLKAALRRLEGELIGKESHHAKMLEQKVTEIMELKVALRRFDGKCRKAVAWVLREPSRKLKRMCDPFLMLIFSAEAILRCQLHLPFHPTQCRPLHT